MRLIILCRFIPGGRTAVTLTCGVIHYPRRRYLTATACAGILWASYAFFLGRLGGQVFEGQLWIGLLLGLGLGLAVSLLTEIARRAWQWRARRRRPASPRARLPGAPAERAAEPDDRPAEPDDRPAAAGVTTRWPG
jgi:membrane protein DedA with SNARE-associated domain